MPSTPKNKQKTNHLLDNKDSEKVAMELITKLEARDSSSNITREGEPKLTATQKAVYKEALKLINDLGIPYAVGAAFARHAYTKIWRSTKDIDLLLLPNDLSGLLETFRSAGFHTEIREQHWLAKAWKKGYFIDLIFGAGHGQIPITMDVLSGRRKSEIVGVPTYLIAVEEMIAANCFIKSRNRYDAPDTLHLIRSMRGKIDWQRVLDRLGDHRELLLIDLLLFDFVYPGHDAYLPKDMMAQLFAEVQAGWEKKDPRSSFRGSLLDSFSYLVDVEDWGYEDRRDTTPLVTREGEQL